MAVSKSRRQGVNAFIFTSRKLKRTHIYRESEYGMYLTTIVDEAESTEKLVLTVVEEAEEHAVVHLFRPDLGYVDVIIDLEDVERVKLERWRMVSDKITKETIVINDIGQKLDNFLISDFTAKVGYIDGDKLNKRKNNFVVEYQTYTLEEEQLVEEDRSKRHAGTRPDRIDTLAIKLNHMRELGLLTDEE